MRALASSGRVKMQLTVDCPWRGASCGANRHFRHTFAAAERSAAQTLRLMAPEHAVLLPCVCMRVYVCASCARTRWPVQEVMHELMRACVVCGILQGANENC